MYKRQGQELLQKWRAEALTLPIVILSSRTDEAGIVAALENGADDYVTKPFGMKELAARLRVAPVSYTHLDVYKRQRMN